MKKLRSFYMHLRHPHTIKRKWIYPLAVGSTVFFFLLFLLTLTSLDGNRIYGYYAMAGNSVFIEDKLRPIGTSDATPLPRFAYLISGSNHDGIMLRRTLLALYHPNNRYVVHLDAESSPEERFQLHEFVKNHPVFVKFGNVMMITKANLVTYRGPTMVANTLHAASLLLRDGGDWDWFINLSASDYPLVTQDDLFHTFSSLPRDLNFIDHTSNIGWKEFQRAKPVIVDPGLYMTEKTDVFWITQRRSVPTAFKLFTGTYNCGLCYGRKTKAAKLQIYTHSDYARDMEDRKCTSGYVCLYSDAAICWSSKKQKIVTLFSTEAEYVAATNCATHTIWLKGLLEELLVKHSGPVEISCDNSSTIKLSMNPVMHQRTKHIDVRFHYLRELVNKEEVKLVFCPTENQIADLMTKPVKLEAFERMRSILGIRELED